MTPNRSVFGSLLRLPFVVSIVLTGYLSWATSVATATKGVSPIETSAVLGKNARANTRIEMTATYTASAIPNCRRLFGPNVDAPAWSPDGKRIAFVQVSKDGRSRQIYLIDPDGANL